MKILIVTSMIFLAGCRTYHVEVDALSRVDTTGKKVFVQTLADGSDLEKEHFTNLAEAALIMSGHEIVGNPAQADFVITFNYGLSSSEKIGSSPTFQWKAPQQYDFNAQTTSYSAPTYYSTGTISESGAGHLEQTGTQVYSYTEFQRFLDMRAFPIENVKAFLKDKTPLKEVWLVKVQSAGESRDMRTLVPIMLSGAGPFLGKNSDGIAKNRYFVPNPKLMELAEKRETEKATPARPPASAP